ncbi:acyltransferase family protein [Mameliella sediminis]|uniref:acyltransferase family protein n=1 Tax=Mameliella sediminis TaxID=2836866 RepID=UPI0031BABF1C
MDGLRTVAVLPVVIFHLGSPLFPGGYVGVDVFFVISGFLITSILLEDIEKDRYSLLDFYKRRILRILPALSVVLLATFFLSGLLFFEAERVETGKSIIAAAAFISNFYFWADAGYFTAPAESKLLLHTWSLAVEEQFYIFFPPLLFAIAKFAQRYMIQIVIGLIVLSLAGCIVLTIKDQPTAFYLLPPRAWELGIGSLLAILAQRQLAPKFEKGWIVGLFGLALTILPMVLLNRTSAFPGWNAIAPVLGAALLIGWGQSGPVGALLSSRLFVEIGKVSYSLYLWHWPVIVFWKAHSGEHLSLTEMTFLAVLSIALAVASTYGIERPFRTSRARAFAPAKVTFCGLIVLVAFGGLGWLGMSGLVTLRSFPDNVSRIASYADYRSWPDHKDQFRTGTCFITQSDASFDAFDQPGCATPDPQKINVLLIGDSHAAQYRNALNTALPEAHVMQATSSGCRALLDAEGAPRCTDLRSWVFTEFLPANDVDLVVLAGRWREAEMPFVSPTLSRLSSLAEHVVVIGPTVEYDGVFPEILARSELTGDHVDFDTVRKPGMTAINDVMRQATEASGATYVDVLGTICPDQTCHLVAPDGAPMQFDYGHLTASGARFVIQEHIETLKALTGRATNDDMK